MPFNNLWSEDIYFQFYVTHPESWVKKKRQKKNPTKQNQKNLETSPNDNFSVNSPFTIPIHKTKKNVDIFLKTFANFNNIKQTRTNEQNGLSLPAIGRTGLAFNSSDSTMEEIFFLLLVVRLSTER